MQKVRSRLVNFRVTDDEFRQLKDASDRQGARCLSAFARKMVLSTFKCEGENVARPARLRSIIVLRFLKIPCRACFTR